MTDQQFTAAAEAYTDMVYRIALNWFRNVPDAEDVTQNTMLRLCGREKSALALNLTGYIISIPVFFDAAFVILIGLIREMAREGKLALNTLVTALVVGLTCTHALVIPTPGPVAVAGEHRVDHRLPRPLLDDADVVPQGFPLNDQRFHGPSAFLCVFPSL